MKSLLDAALAYARCGWPVVPLFWPTSTGSDARCACGSRGCRSIGKHPHGKLVPHGLKDASTDEAVLRGWWGECPSANVGIVLGEAAGAFAIDVDPKNGGDRTLIRAVSELGPLGDTLHAHTGSGGDHYLFRWPGRPVSGSAHKLGRGLDVKGDGGYIVAAPSLHPSGARYVWERLDAPLLDAPGWVIARIFPAPAVNVPATTLRAPLPSLSGHEALDVLVRECEFIRHAVSATSVLTYDEWFGLATILKTFPAGGALFDQISRRDPERYRPGEAEKKLASIRGAPRYCTSLGWHCPRLSECASLGVRSPAGLPFKLRRKPST